MTGTRVNFKIVCCRNLSESDTYIKVQFQGPNSGGRTAPHKNDKNPVIGEKWSFAASPSDWIVSDNPIRLSLYSIGFLSDGKIATCQVPTHELTRDTPKLMCLPWHKIGDDNHVRCGEVHVELCTNFNVSDSDASLAVGAGGISSTQQTVQVASSPVAMPPVAVYGFQQPQPFQHQQQTMYQQQQQQQAAMMMMMPNQPPATWVSPALLAQLAQNGRTHMAFGRVPGRDEVYNDDDDDDTDGCVADGGRTHSDMPASPATSSSGAKTPASPPSTPAPAKTPSHASGSPVVLIAPSVSPASFSLPTTTPAAAPQQLPGGFVPNSSNPSSAPATPMPPQKLEEPNKSEEPKKKKNQKKKTEDEKDDDGEHDEDDDGKSDSNDEAEKKPDPNNIQPTARPNPVAYAIINSNNNTYTIMNNQQTEIICKARVAGKTSVDIGNGRQIDLTFRQSPAMPDTGVNAKNDCIEYVPCWYFLDDNARWSSLSPQMNYTLCKAKFEGKLEARDSERTYFLDSYNQINRSSQVKRPLLYLRADGTAVRGNAVANWAYEGLYRDAPATVNLPFATANALDAAYNSGAPGLDFQFKVDGSSVPYTAKLKFLPGAASHNAEVDIGGGQTQLFKFIRYFPTWFYMDDGHRWCSLDYMTTTKLDIAQSSGLFTAKDHEREYDLIRLEQRNSKTGLIRPLVHVLGHNGAAPGSSPAQHGQHPDIFARAKLLTNPSFTVEQLRAKINDSGASPIERLLYFCNGLVHHHRFVIKGGIIRDAVVKNDIAHSHDVDIELPQLFQQHQLDAWITNFLVQIEQQFGVKRDPSKEVVKRNSWDVLGPAVGRVPVTDGIVTIPVVLPGSNGVAIDLECCTPWNTVYNPPSNVDVSVNNLRVTADSTELLQNVPLFYGPSMERFSVQDIIDQILRFEASPCYDFKWIPGDAAAKTTGEGVSKKKWCVGHHDKNPMRTKMMEKRFVKMRTKGYRMIESPQ